MLTRRHHTLSQLLFYKGCVTETEIKKEISLESKNNDEDENNLDIEPLINEINLWNENNAMSLQIEAYEWIDGQIYYGWRCTVSNDEISKQSMTALTSKQLSFWKIYLNIAIANSGLISLNTASAVLLHLNRSGLLGIKNILAQTEMCTLFKILEEKKYIALLDDDELSQDQEEKDEYDRYFVIGPRSFIDLKSWMDQKTEHAKNECVLCKDYVMYKGFRCGHARCPNVTHTHCIRNYFDTVNNGSFKCPSCQNAVDIESMDEIATYIHLLNYPNDALQIIEDLKQNRQQANNQMNDSEDDTDSE